MQQANRIDYQAIARRLLRAAQQREMARAALRPARGELCEITIGIAGRPHRDIVISRELAHEVLTALDGASKLGSHVGAHTERSDIAEWGDDVRTRTREAAQRLRRAAMSQESAA